MNSLQFGYLQIYNINSGLNGQQWLESHCIDSELFLYDLENIQFATEVWSQLIKF